MESAFEKDVRPLLDLIDTLRSLGLNHVDHDANGSGGHGTQISLPQICVMGDQSSGKSSVLQAICGIPFPRGSGLVTRCPTELIMSKSPKDSAVAWTAHITTSRSQREANIGAFGKAPPFEGHVSSVHELCEKIELLTDYLTSGSSNSFSTDSIIIKLSAPESPDLTIIDLPGIVRTATSGQNTSVVSEVNSLIDRYISMPNTIILAVVPCNQDIATVDILERASVIDPMGLRTIAVLTKPDLINPGGEAEVLEILENKKKPLKLGYIMVKNMTQKQLNDKLTVEEARADELRFFAEHPVFSPLLNSNSSSSSRLGVVELTKSLTSLLVATIKLTLPAIISDVKRMLQHALQEMQQMGIELPTDIREKQSLLAKKISNYCQLFRCSIRGEYRDNAGLLAANPNMRLHHQFQQSYRKMQEAIAHLRPATSAAQMEELYERLELDMVSQRGRELPGFLNSQVFYAHIVQLVEEWRPLIEECRSEIMHYTLGVSNQISRHIIAEFPELSTAVQSIADQLIESTARDVAEKLDALVTREQDPFTTQDVLLEVVNSIRFRTFENVLRQVLDTTDLKAVGGAVATPSSSSNGNQKVDPFALREDLKNRLGAWYMMRHGVDVTGNQQEMVTLIQAYWDIASRRLTDNVCMCIEMEFSQQLIKELEAQCVLFGISVEDDKVTELLMEDVSISKRRRFLHERIQLLQAAVLAFEKATGVM